ncbi:Fic family protein [Atopobium minutum]|uniref:Fic family protein n=1 Tax=Atopobium minutum TaxID=1381 RepID=UPI0025F26B17|nr:Fic family protein [Atopobium minutum]
MDILSYMHTNSLWFEDFITRFTYHSNAIEGSTLSFADTYAILWNDNSMKVNATARELYDAINHKYALQIALQKPYEELTERLIKDIAIQINKNINDIDGYRKTQVYIRSSEYVPPKASEINQLMQQLLYNHVHTVYDSIFEKEAAFHITFEHIHPFVDGNGRTGRILLNRVLIAAKVAPIVIPVESKSSYLEAIETYDTQGLAKLIESLSVQEKLRMKEQA